MKVINAVMNGNDEKIENLLNVSTSVSKDDLEKNMELVIGYDNTDDTWELIVKYTGDGSVLEKYAQSSPVFLLGNYGVVRVKEDDIFNLSREESVIYIEKPKMIFENVTESIYGSCINQIQNEEGIYGEGVLVGFVDSGIDYTHPAFLNGDGTSRIMYIWDQNGESDNNYFGKGSVYTQENINEALRSDNPYSIVPAFDLSGHGTHVAGIATGNFSENKNSNIGIATKSSIIMVKLDNGKSSLYPGTIQLMEGIDFIVRKSLELGMPLALNISYGNNYGSHDGQSILETYIDYVSTLGQIGIAVGTGNEGNSMGHSSVILVNGESQTSEISVSDFERSLNIQIWKNYEDDFNLTLVSPGGEQIFLSDDTGQQEFVLERENSKVIIFYGEPKPYSVSQEIFIQLLPQDMYISRGIWRIIFSAVNIVEGTVDLYIQTAAALNANTGFLRNTPQTTLTIPSTASKVVSVGAYDARTGAYANFSGRGYTRYTNQVKPDILAPGVDIVSAAPGGGYSALTGTSMATPFVSGSMALLMEWGIVRGNDRFLYGDKLKAYLRKKATRDSGTDYPNNKEGYGKLCIGNPNN